MGTGRTLGREILVFQVFSETDMRDAGEWDDVFRQAKMVATTDGIGTTNRDKNTQTCKVPGQIASGDEFFSQQQEGGGDAPQAVATVVIAIRDLKLKGLWSEAHEEPVIHVNDRLVRIEDRTGKRIWEESTNPRLYVTTVDEWRHGGTLFRFLLGERVEAA